MKFIRGLWRILLSISTYILAIMIVLALTMGVIAGMIFLQWAIFVPDDFIIWVAHDSGIRVVFVFEIIFIALFFYIINRKKVYFKNLTSSKVFRAVKKHKGRSLALFSGILIIMIYFMIANMSVVSSDKIVRHTFFMPWGREYLYSDIENINTGVYGNNIPFVRSKGEFYYIVELNDGAKINLNNSGGTKDNKDIYLTIMDLDRDFVKNGIPKKVDSRYFHLLERDLAKIYSDRIKSVLENEK